MIRRGVSGGSSELLSSEQKRFIDTHSKADLERLGSDFPYDDVWGNQADAGKEVVATESQQTT